MLRAMYDAQLKADGDVLKAQASLAEILDRDAERKGRLARLQAEKVEAIAEIARDYRLNSGKADLTEAFMGVLENRNALLLGAPSVVGRRDAIVGQFHARLEELLYDQRRKFFSGKRMNPARIESVVRELFGEASGDESAAAMARALGSLFDEASDRFNGAGGDIAKRADYFAPSRHDARAIAAAGPEGWKTFVRDKLDLSRMIDPRTGGRLDAARLDEALESVYRRIVTDGAIDREPNGQAVGRGMLANQRQDHRFLVFKDSEAFLAYHRAFGGNDLHALMFGHLQAMAKDIAALEILGPNPQATVTWMQNAVAQEAAKARLGEASLYNADGGALKHVAEMFGGREGPAVTSGAGGDLAHSGYLIERLWTAINGAPMTGNQNVADGFAAVRSLLQGSLLGGAALTAVVSDPWQQRTARAVAGVPMARWFASLPQQLFKESSKREIVRAGVVMEDAMEHLRTDVRGFGLWASSAELSRWVPDRVFQWTGMTPWTRANRRASAMDFMFEAGDRAGQTLADMAADGVKGQQFARHLQGFGISEDQWALIRKAPALDHGEAGGLLRVVDIIDQAPNDKAVLEAAMRYSEALHAFIEEATPSATNRVRAAMGRVGDEGTFKGELARTSTMFLGYPITMAFSTMRAIAHEVAAGQARGIAYATTAVIGLTLGGAMVVQLAEMRRGRDPRSVADAEFWALALAKGGAMGFYGDFILSEFKRGSADTAARFAGPVGSVAADTLSLLNVRALAAEDDANRARVAVNMGRRYIPFQNMWMIKPFTERYLWDQLQLMADPEANRAWKRRERQLAKDTGQSLWWGPGESGPRRGPDFSGIFAP